MNCLKSIIKGMIISTIGTVIAIIIFSLILSKTNISEKYISVVIITIFGISIFAGTMFATKKIHKNGAIIGVATTAAYIIIMYLISSSITGDFSLNGKSFAMIISVLLLGGIGGVMGVNIK